MSKGIKTIFRLKIITVIIMKNKNKKSLKPEIEISAKNVEGNPDTAFELINKYGTYEIQPTADSDNKFPEIAQGLPKKRKDGKNE